MLWYMPSNKILSPLFTAANLNHTSPFPENLKQPLPPPPKQNLPYNRAESESSRQHTMNVYPFID